MWIVFWQNIQALGCLLGHDNFRHAWVYVYILTVISSLKLESYGQLPQGLHPVAIGSLWGDL